MEEVTISGADLERLAALLPAPRADELRATAVRTRTLLAGRTVWHASSTSSGGGVAELLHTLLGYAVPAGVMNRWLVLQGDAGFFDITKRIHNWLHGVRGDRGDLTGEELRHYDTVTEQNAQTLRDLASPGDIVVLHDPQTAGLAPHLRDRGLRVVWRCHVGRDLPNEYTDVGWDFLRPHVDAVDAFIFSRRVYAPAWVDDERLHVIPPSIDPFSPKNMAIPAHEVPPLLARVGLLSGSEPDTEFAFRRRDRSIGAVRPHARRGGLVLEGVAPPSDCPLVVQVSRWDRLKDFAGVMRGFVAMLDHEVDPAAHLLLVGPETSAVTDDPEGTAVLADCREIWRGLPGEARQRVHLATIPMDDPEENAIIVNAVQRQARVVVQKSLAEGFGLTVTEAMWKSRAMLASRVGGIQDQIRHGRDGLLLDDPTDVEVFARSLAQLLADEDLTRRLGAAAHARVLDQYVGDLHLERYADLCTELVER